jgi:hypothetical protein
MLGTYFALRDAVEHRSLVRARRGDAWLTLCPHMLGWRDDEPYVVAYTATGPRQWLCLPVLEISYVWPTEGPWRPEGSMPPPPKEMELDDVVVRSSG